jgi:hypothetical protein
MALATLVEKVLGVDSIKALIEERLVEERTVPYLTVDKGYVRSSGFAEMCPREEVICSINKVERHRKIGAPLMLTFEHGHGLHFSLQNHILPNIGIMLGEWKCLGCDKTYGHMTGPATVWGESNGVGTDMSQLAKRPESCDSCGHKEFFYQEQFLINEEHRVTGHPDGFIEMKGAPGIGIFEAKSINADGFIKVHNTPSYSHVVQVHLYMWMCDLKWAQILYWNKEGVGVRALKEHHIERDEEVIDVIKSELKSLWSGISTGKLPTRICEYSDCPRAKKCAVATQCFSHSD